MKSLHARYLRIFFGLLGWSAVITEVVVLMNQGVFNPSNFFSFFTILSNIAAASFLLYYGVTNDNSRNVQVTRGAITLYMLMTGVIFALLLSGLADVRLTAIAWDNTVLHYIMPIVVVLDWMLNPPRNRLPVSVVKFWILFPIIYVVYTLLRGSIVVWYPYPFLNPQMSSYTQVTVTSIVIALFVFVAAFFLQRVGTIKYKSVAKKRS